MLAFGFVINLENEKAVNTGTRVRASHCCVELDTLVAGLRQELITSGRLSALISQLSRSCWQIPRVSRGDGRPNGKLPWYHPILSLNSDRPERLENVIKSFVPVFPGLGWSCLLLWNKASGIRGICGSSLCWNTCLLEGKLQIFFGKVFERHPLCNDL